MELRRDIVVGFDDREAKRGLDRIKKQSQNINREFKKTEATTRKNIRFSERWKRSMEGIARQAGNLRKAFGGIAGILAGVGVSLSGGLIFNEIRKSSEALDELKKTADSIGIGNANFLNQLRLVADLEGIDPSKIAEGFEFLDKQIGQFLRDGTGTASKSIDFLGIGEAIKNADSLEKRFAVVLDSIRAADKDLQASFLSEFFGRSGGADFKKLLDTPPDELIATFETARKALGNYSDDYFKRAAEFNDSLTVLQASWKSLKTEIFQAPSSIEWIENISERLQIFRKEIEKTQSVYKGLTSAIAGPLDQEQIELQRTAFGDGKDARFFADRAQRNIGSIQNQIKRNDRTVNFLTNDPPRNMQTEAIESELARRVQNEKKYNRQLEEQTRILSFFTDRLRSITAGVDPSRGAVLDDIVGPR